MSLTYNELKTYAMSKEDIGNEPDVLHHDCDIVEYLLDNCEIIITESDRFFCKVNCDGIMTSVFLARSLVYLDDIRSNGLMDGEEALAYTGRYDCSHTNAEWESVTSLGIFGLLQRIEDYGRTSGNDVKKTRFYSEIARVYRAALRFISRVAVKARMIGKYEMAEGLEHLTKGAPQNLFEAMQNTLIYYVLQHMVEGTCLRTLGRLDSLYYPYYFKDGLSDFDTEALFIDFMRELDSYNAPANMPFAIGGTDENGKSLVNELSHIIVSAYRKARTHNTKFHILCSNDTPDTLIRTAFEGIRDGNNSIVFMSDGKIIESLVKLGEDKKHATNYHVVGCYECGGDGEITCSCSARVNLLKALEVTLNGGRDMQTGKLIGLETDSIFSDFDALYKEFVRQTVYFCERAMTATDIFEKHYNKIHSAPIMSGTYTSALEKGGDLYCDSAARYNNSSLNAVGLGSTVDSLYAIKKLVFEDKKVTLEKLILILRSDWEDEEPLRLYVKNKIAKYGQGNPDVDELARQTVDYVADTVNGRPNSKGGVFRLGLFSIDWRWILGEKTAASADGRHCAEVLSQNSSAAVGNAIEGATSHLRSVAAIDASRTPNATIADIDLHYSAVSGENGISALVSSLKAYFKLGGFGVHYNVLNTDILIDAMHHPEKYPDLQVRLCGWNVLFNTLSQKEQMEFIKRSTV